MLTSEVLNKAADLIEERGWTLGDWGLSSETAPMCLEGAIFAAAGLGRGAWLAGLVECPAYDAVASHLDYPYLARDMRLGTQRIYAWNDNHERTASEVIEVLRAAAAIEQARESQAVAVSA